ncbi:hypothetical protein C8R44DRAFT_896157 [Mycena epipterygia]|nr:hypothetical protein C8R44DRAFT_896157 [Mycena epipterygia]
MVKSYTDYFVAKPSTARDTETGLWLSNIRLCLTPELESLMEAPIQALLAWKLPGVAPLERKRRILSVGYALLHLLAIQHELGEELNVNGDKLLELFDKTIVPCKLDATEALRAMFLATDTVDLKYRKGWNLDQFSRHMLRFNADHTIYDSSLQPPTLKRVEPPIIIPNHPVLFDIRPAANTSTQDTILPHPVVLEMTQVKKRKRGGSSADGPAKNTAKKLTGTPEDKG